MKLAKKVLDFLLYSNIFIGVCALGLTFTNQLTVEGTIRFDNTCWFIFFSTIFTYSYFKFRSANGNFTGTSHRAWAMQYPQLSRNILLISLLATTCFFFLLKRDMQLLVILLALVTVFYGFLPIPFTSPKKKLREYGLAKTLFVALVWTVTTVAIPLVDSGVTESMFIFLLLRRFLFITALILIFEIKDMKGDYEHHIITVPMTIGVVNTKLLSQLLLFALMGIIAIQYFFYGISFANMMGVNLSLLVSIFCIQPVTEETGEEWYYLVLDGMLLVQFIFVYVAAKLFE